MIQDLSPAQGDETGGQRLLSLDALRGFDMFWIIGGAAIVHQGALLIEWPWLRWLDGQLHHPDWHGFAFYDLIFPLFLFLAGVAMPFSFAKRRSRGDSDRQICRHVILRGLVLVLLGMIYNGLLQFDWANMRYPSVLGRIGLAYLLAGLIVLNSDVRACLWWIVGILIGYWAALKFIPVPGFGAGDLAPGHTLTDYIDRLVIPGRLHVGDRDPEGLLGTIPAIATALSGAVTGQFLKRNRSPGAIQSLLMAGLGLVCLGLATVWNYDFPINKNLWTSSFVLHCTGWSLLLLATFYLVIDVWRFQAWSLFFVVIGSNSIFIYMAKKLIDFTHTTDFLFQGVLATTGPWQPLLGAVAYVAVQWSLLYLLYRHKIFLRV